MLDAVLAGLLSVVTGSNGVVCHDGASRTENHLEDVCDKFFQGASAYSVTYQVSLSPPPASQQVMIYRLKGVWFMRIAGYRWRPGEEVVTKRRDIAISDADAMVLVSRLTKDALGELSTLPYYGSKDVICTDGASLELAMTLANRKFTAAQHSCAGKTEINQIAAMFRELALAYDPDFTEWLSGLRN